jgi:hypothetical protein
LIIATLVVVALPATPAAANHEWLERIAGLSDRSSHGLAEHVGDGGVGQRATPRPHHEDAIEPRLRLQQARQCR